MAKKSAPQEITMDQLAQEQEGLGKEIQRIISNYKKDPADRKQKQYYEERLKRLESAWELFEATDNKIRLLPDIPSSHQYFTTDYYQSICELYHEYREHFAEKISTYQEEDNLNAIEESQQLTIKDAKSIQKKPVEIVNLHPKSKEAINNYRQNSNTNEVPSSLPSMSPEVTKILRRQNSVIQSLRRLLSSIEYQNQSKHYYEVKLRSLNQYWTQVEAQNHDIWELLDDPAAIGYNLEAYIQLEEEVQQHLININSKLSEPNSAPTPSLSTSSVLNLPKLTLPKFDGDYLKWRQFADLFKEMVHKQPMANVQKMWYLKTNMTGEAEKLVRHFTLTEDNYAAAWKMLCDRYENPRLLVAALVNKLLSQPSHASENASAASIKNLHDTTQECLMGLENLNVSTANWDPLLLHILIKKLDRATHTLYEQSLNNPRELQTIHGFLAFLQTRFQSMEALGNKTKTSDDHQRKCTAVKSLSTTATLTQAACISCKGNHPLFACKNFLKLTPTSRLSLLRKHDLCINCLKGGHSSARCTLGGCRKCGKLHNTLVHVSVTEKSNNPNTTQPVSSFSQGHNPSTSTVAELATVAAITKQTQRKYILLSTVRIKLINAQGKEVECRAILDSGSQVNLITEKLTKVLGLKPTVDPLVIHGVGKGKQQAQRRINVLMQSRINDFTSRLEAFVLPQIISVQQKYLLTHLHGQYPGILN